MSNNLQDAFNSLLKRSERQMQIEREAQFAAENLKVSVSNYYRNLAAPESIAIEGREFVITKTNLNATANYHIPKRGDLLIDPELGTMTITEIREMFGLGGTIIGYRVRTS